MTHGHQLLDAAAHDLCEFVESTLDDNHDNPQLEACRDLILAIAEYTIQLATERQAANTIRKPNDRP